MNLIEAIKSGRPYRRKLWNQGNGRWREPLDFKTQWRQPVCERLDDITADDWEIQEPAVTITRSQFWRALQMEPWGYDPESDPRLQSVARKLGLED